MLITIMITTVTVWLRKNPWSRGAEKEGTSGHIHILWDFRSHSLKLSNRRIGGRGVRFVVRMILLVLQEFLCN